MAEESTFSPPSRSAEVLADREPSEPSAAAAGLVSRLAKRLFVKALESVETGELTLIDGAERRVFGAATDDFPIRAIVRVLDPRFYPEVLIGGSIGAGEAWAHRLWDSEDLTAVVRVLIRNRPALQRMDGGLVALARPLATIAHRLRDNTLAGSRRNIAAHYDLSNEFFSLFLDPTMMYSSAIFPDWTTRLEQASEFKLDLICRKLDLGPNDEVLEIGTGWGGFALHAAKNYGCRVVTTTISREQHDFSRQRIEDEGLGDRITTLLEDYRALPTALGRRFHKLVSVEMIEAVGHRHMPVYFETIGRLLAPAGRALLQAITIRDHEYERYRRSVDFIQRHIFPGGLVPSLARISECVRQRTDTVVTHLEDLTPHYATTLEAWRRRFLRNREQISELGLDDVFQRLWEFYFAYCEGGFRERSIGAIQLLLAKPLDRSRPISTTL